MFSSLGSWIRTTFLLFILLITFPTVFFLVSSYYRDLVTSKTYIGFIELPSYIDRADEIISSAKALFRADQIKAIIIKCDGQGGNPGACQALYYDLKALKENSQKPLIAYSQRGCGYGFYAIAAAADKIVMSPATKIEGLGLFNNKKDTYDDINHMRQNKDYWTILHESRPAHAQLYGAHVQDGSLVLTGAEGKDYGLVDVLGGTLEVERQIRQMVQVKGKLEEVRGSWVEHFLFFLSGGIMAVVKAFKQASSTEGTTGFFNAVSKVPPVIAAIV